jgi:hypothetical protein
MELCLSVKGRMKKVQLAQVHKGHVVAPLMIDEYGAFVESIWQGKAIEIPVPMPLCAHIFSMACQGLNSGSRVEIPDKPMTQVITRPSRS